MLLTKSCGLWLGIGLVLLAVGCTPASSTPSPEAPSPALSPLPPVQDTAAPKATVNLVIAPPLSGQSGGATSLAFSPDGKTLASIYENGEIILWDVATRQNARSFMGQGEATGLGRIPEIAFSPDGKSLVSASHANGLMITLWDVATGQSIEMERDLSHGDGMALSPDGKMLAYGTCEELGPGSHCSQYEIILWDMSTRQPTGQSLAFRVGAPAPLGLLFSPDGKLLAAMSSGTTGSGRIELFDVVTRQSIASPLGGEVQFSSMAFSPDGNSMALGGIASVIYIWHTKSQQVLSQMTGEKGLVTSVIVSPNGKTLASRILIPSTEHIPQEKIVLWDLDNLQTIGQPLTGQAATGNDVGLISLAFSPDGLTLASGTSEGAIILWDLATSSQVPFQHTLNPHKSSCESCMK